MKIKAPEGWKNFAMGGQENTLYADGTIELPDAQARFLIDKHGFTAVPIVSTAIESAPEADHEQ